MGLHARHNVGRAFHGEEARKHLAERKRDSHGLDLKWHVPEGYVFDNKVVENDVTTATDSDVETAVSVVYVTLPQTFAGSASYMTLTSDSSSASSAAQMEATALAAPARSSASTSASLNSDEASYAAVKSAANALTTSSAMPAAITAASSTLATTSLVNAQVGGTPLQTTRGSSATVVGGTPIAATRSASPSAGAIEQTSNGMSGGAKAGLAFGIIIAFALAFGLIFFCWRRKKNSKDHEQIIDEKHASFADATARHVEADHSNNINNNNNNNNNNYADHRASVMSEKVPASIRSTRTASTAPRLSLRPVTQFLPNLSGAAGALGLSEKPKSAWERKPANAQENPFDDAPVLSEKQARPASPPSNPFEERNGTTAAVVASKHSPKSSSESQPATPKSTKFGTAAAVPVAAAAGNANSARGPNNVHRVQLDFKPSMDDELELRSGQLVRMLHEYDDGWALCIRMDRSQQGVAPRTCLSKMPVKPRPQGPPPPQGSRPGTAHSHSSNGSNGSVGSARRPSNPPRPNTDMVPRPLTPTQAGRDESPSVPARKPVPGQAM